MFTLINPMHPGEFLKEAYLEPTGMTVTELASKLGVSKATVSRLVTCKSELSYEMAIRLSKVFERTPDGWMALQIAYGLKQAEKKLEVSI
ncbi:HigA family addiction module antitoxin [Marinomonas polaris]|uniref:HigA family addiction module antitoxin n=1 Tax=Marinomonas polaris TaxID=293552 RepID=UPI003F957EE0